MRMLVCWPEWPSYWPEASKVPRCARHDSGPRRRDLPDRGDKHAGGDREEGHAITRERGDGGEDRRADDGAGKSQRGLHRGDGGGFARRREMGEWLQLPGLRFLKLPRTSIGIEVSRMLRRIAMKPRFGGLISKAHLMFRWSYYSVERERR